MSKPIAPCLWFNNNAEEAVNYYVSVFKDSKVLHIDRYSDVGPDPDAPVVFIEFQINGQPFQAINGGPMFTFSEAISFCIECADQDELDYYWNTLIDDGGEPSQCGWLKDKLRRLVADRADGAQRPHARRRPRARRPGHAADAADEQARHRGPAGRLRPVATNRKWMHEGGISGTTGGAVQIDCHG